MRKALAVVASGMWLTACSVVGVRTTEEPPYQVLRQVGAVEVRSYGPRLAADVVIDGDAIDARSRGFEVLAGYIFGGNTSRQSLAMTAPVAQAGETLAMTAPVDQAAVAPARDAAGRWRVRFFMPATSTRATLPVPNDPRIEIVEVPGEVVAVLRYAGVPSKAAVQSAQARLLQALAAEPVIGAPFDWFYDPPWTLPPLRRNEAVVRLAA